LFIPGKLAAPIDFVIPLATMPESPSRKLEEQIPGCVSPTALVLLLAVPATNLLLFVENKKTNSETQIV